MNLNDLLQKNGISPADVLVLRHRPSESKLRRMLPWLAIENPDLYNAYQQTQSPMVDKAFARSKFIVSCIGTTPKFAVFAGLYSIDGSNMLSYEEFWANPNNITLRDTFGIKGFLNAAHHTRWFDLRLCTDFYESWRGRLVFEWPGGERSWCRKAKSNTFTIHAIREACDFEAAMPHWSELVVSWAELQTLPSRWKSALKEWRGIYYIWDSSDGLGYVGSAYGAENILGRWLGYKSTGHGGNKRLKNRNPKNFMFSILQRVSPDMLPDEVVQIENTWKVRLHTKEIGLNEN